MNTPHERLNIAVNECQRVLFSAYGPTDPKTMEALIALYTTGHDDAAEAAISAAELAIAEDLERLAETETVNSISTPVVKVRHLMDTSDDELGDEEPWAPISPDSAVAAPGTIAPSTVQPRPEDGYGTDGR